MLSDGSFWCAVAERTATALDAGALAPISTTSEVIQDGGVRFLTRVAKNLERKRLDGIRKPSGFDPFAEPEPELFVGEISDTHYAVLNKFNTVDEHVIVATREYEEQDAPLSREDFDAVWRGLSERDALAFYNSGPEAGASQRHKHLQLVPVPLGEGPERVPMEAVLGDETREPPFAHAFCRVDGSAHAHGEHRRLLDSVGNPRAFNLLATRDWMLVVPRARESWLSISVNALGFAGSLLVRSDEELSRLERLGPMRLLREVTPNV